MIVVVVMVVVDVLVVIVVVEGTLTLPMVLHPIDETSDINRYKTLGNGRIWMQNEEEGREE